MLGLAPKRGVPVVMTKPMMAYLDTTYGKEAQSKSGAVAALNKLRDEVAACTTNLHVDPHAAKALHEKYFAALKEMSTRFPFAHHNQSFFSRKTPTVMVNFTWHDSYFTSVSVSDPADKFERACVLYNIGAYFSLCGIKEDRSQNTGLTAAYKYFQSAAGVFQHLVEEYEGVNMNAVDLSTTCFKMNSHLMLAQAQACYFEMAVSKGTSAKLVAKLAAGTAMLFNNALVTSRQAPMYTWLAKAKYNWNGHFQYQVHCFNAAAHYWQAKVHLENDEYGKEIARLNLAKDACGEARKYESLVVPTLKDSRAKLLSLITERLNAALKDNDTVYHYAIPKGNELDAVETLHVVKSTSYDENSIQEDREMKEVVASFASLVPIAASQDAERYAQQLQQVLGDMRRECQESSDLAKMTLASMNLPAALEAMEPDAGIPSKLWDRVREVQFKGGIQALDELVKSVQGAANRANQAHREVDNMLEKEAREDAENRNKWGSQWNRAPSQQITAGFKKDSDTVRSYLQAASKSDHDILKEFGEKRATLETLKLSKEQLEAKLPQHSAGSGDKNAASEKVKALLDELSNLLECRQVYLQTFEEKIGKENITVALMKAGDSKTADQIFAEERKKFEPLQKDISATLDRQTELLANIAQANEAFTASRTSNAVLAQREKVMQEINVGVDLYNKLEANFSEGIKFYGDILKDYVAPLRQTVSDFVMARDQEKLLILQQIQSDLASRGSSSGSSGSYGNAAADSGSDASLGMYAPAPAYTPSFMDPQEAASGSAPPASNPNMGFHNAPSVYPAQGGSSGLSGYARPNMIPAAPPAPQPKVSESKDSKFTCPACTFINPGTAVYCKMCNAENPSPAPATPATSAPPAATASNSTGGGWRGFFS